MDTKRWVDEQEIASLYQAHYQHLCLVSLNYLHDVELARDIVQNFFVNYWERLSQGIEAPDNFGGYASRAVRNLSIDFLRRQQVQDKRKTTSPLSEDYTDPEAEREEQEHYYIRLERIFALIEQLPEGQQKILKLHALQKMSYAQIAQQQGVSVNTVRTQLTRAYSSLRKSASGLILLALFKYM